MRISTHSWHYRLLGFYDFSHPPNLCPYFWKVVGTILATPFIFLLIIIGGPILHWAENREKHKEEKEEREEKPKMSHAKKINIIKIFAGIWCTSFAIWFWIREDYTMFGIMVGLLIWNVMPLGKVFRKRTYRERKPKKPKEPNIAWEYLKAKKHRYCPVITFYTPEMEDESWKKGLQ